MRFDKLIKSIPFLPFSAIIFYLLVLLLFYFGVIPSSAEVINFLENLYEKYGLLSLFVATFLEGLVYIGLYFSGSFIILLIVLFSDGKFISLLNISLIIALALTLTSIINYSLGRHIVLKSQEREIKKNRNISKGLILSSIHPNSLAFYFFNLGLKKEELWKILFVPIIMIPYGLFLAFLIILSKPVIQEGVENPYILIMILLAWFVIAFILKNKK